MRTSVDVANYLTEHEVAHEVFPTRGRLRTPERLAAVLDLPPEEVGKVVILDGDEGPVVAVVPAGRDVDPSKVRRATGRHGLAPASHARASEVTGYLAEAIPPVGLPAGLPVVVDRSLARDRVLYFPGGEARAVLKLRGTDLIRATGATVASIAARHEPGG